jgi:predicted MFS family arabinose efflux permease
MGYLLRIPSYRLLVGASTLVYFFFSGTRTFGMIYFTNHYHLSRSAVSGLALVVGVGAVAGLKFGGWLSNRLLQHGNLNSRIIVPAGALFAAVPILAVGLWTTSSELGLLLMTLGVAALATAVPPIDAARLDVVSPGLWGRGEAGRMALRSAFEGGAPLLFGAISMWLGGGDHALMLTLLMMLIPMGGAGLLVLPGTRSYRRDVATVAESIEAMSKRRRG